MKDSSVGDLRRIPVPNLSFRNQQAVLADNPGLMAAQQLGVETSRWPQRVNVSPKLQKVDRFVDFPYLGLLQAQSLSKARVKSGRSRGAGGLTTVSMLSDLGKS